MGKRISYLLVLLMVFMLVSCTTKTEDTIIGAWDDGLGEITEFSEDGAIYIGGVEELKYQLLEDGQIEILDPYFNTRKLYEYSFEDGKLLFLDRELTRAEPGQVNHDHDGDGKDDH